MAERGCPIEGIRSIPAEFRCRESLKIFEQDVIAGILSVFGVAVPKLSVAETGTRVVRCSVVPIEQPPIEVGHHLLIGFSSERFAGFTGKEAARLLCFPISSGIGPD